MNPEIKTEFLEELRKTPGKAVGMLHWGEHFCALGVLGNIYIRHNPDKAGWEIDNPNEPIPSYRFKKQGDDYNFVAVLPDEVITWAGLPLLYSDGEGTMTTTRRIVDLNDKTELTLAQIADKLEEML